MKKILVTLMMVFGLSVAAFADVTLLSKDTFNDIASVFEDTPSIQPQIGYIADTWEDVYEKTGVSKYGWKDRNSEYCDITEQSFLIIIKCKVRGDLGWICLEYPGDGSSVLYTADAD